MKHRLATKQPLSMSGAPMLLALLLVPLIACGVKAQPENRIGQWEFDTGSGETAFEEIAGHHGTMINVGWAEDSFAGYSAVFAGNNSYIEIPDAAGLDVTNKLTIEVWLKPDYPASHTTQTIISRGGMDFQYLLLLTENSLIFRVGHAEIVGTFTAEQWPAGTWHKVSVLFSLEHRQAQIYLDNGILISLDDFEPSIESMQTPIFIGGAPNNPTQGFQGKLDHLILTNSYLMVAWIADIYIPENRRHFDLEVGSSEIWDLVIHNWYTWPTLHIESIHCDNPTFTILSPIMTEPIAVTSGAPLVVKVLYQPYTLRDQEDPFRGVITVVSDDRDSPTLNVYLTGTARDSQAPHIGHVSPTDGATTDRDTPIYFEVIDEETGVDLSSVTVTINDVPATEEDLLVSVIPYGYAFTYSPNGLPGSTLFEVALQAADFNVPPNPMAPYEFTFTTTEYEDTVRPAIDPTGLTPQPNTIGVLRTSDVTITLTDQGAGIDLASIIISINGALYRIGDPGVGIQGTYSKYLITVFPLPSSEKSPALEPALFGYGQLVTVSVTACDRSNPPSCLVDYRYTFTTELEAVDRRPAILMAGNIAAPLSEATGGSIYYLAIVQDPDGLEDLEAVEVYYAGSPTGVVLVDNGTQGDGEANDGIYGLLVEQIAPGVPAGAYNLEIIARDKHSGHSDPWFMGIVHEHSQQANRRRPIPLTTLNGLTRVVASGSTMTGPQILLGGLGNSILDVEGNSLLETYAIVQDAGAGIGIVELLLNNLPTGVALAYVSTFEGTNLDLFVFETAIDTPLGSLPPLDLGFIARDPQGNSGFSFPDLQVVGNQLPEAVIEIPSNAAQFALGSSIIAQGKGVDPEDGTLPPSQLYWLIDEAQVYGPEQTITITNLGEGLHTIALYALDTLSRYARTDIKVTVVRQESTPPEVQIVQPVDDAFFTTTQNVNFLGTGTQYTSGAPSDIPNEQLLWYSDKRGFLGAGAELPVDNLAGDSHVITLIGRDSSYREARATIEIAVSPIISCVPTYPDQGQILCTINAQNIKSGDRFHMHWYLGEPPHDELRLRVTTRINENQPQAAISWQYPGAGTSLPSGTKGRVEIFYNDQMELLEDQQTVLFQIPG